MTEFEEVGLEIVKFMRGKYRLDEVAGMYYDVPRLKFRQGKKIIAEQGVIIRGQYKQFKAMDDL